MSTLLRRTGNVYDMTHGDLRPPSPGHRVLVLKAGGIVSAASAGATLTLYPGHGIEVGSKIMLGSDTSTFSGVHTVASTTSTTITMSGGTYATSVGDRVLQLGPDSGVSTPNWDGSTVQIYSTPATTTAITDEQASVDSGGEYGYWHGGANDLWEVVLSPLGAVIGVNVDAYQTNSTTRYAHIFATGGDGSTENPWTGWEAAIAAGAVIHFPAGYYSHTSACTIGDGTVIKGDPGAIIRRVAAGVSARIFTCSSAVDDVVITGLTFDGNSLVATAYDLFFYAGSTRIRITDNYWTGIGSRTEDLVHFDASGVGEALNQYVEVSRNRVVSGTTTSTYNTFQFNSTSDLICCNNQIVKWGAIKCEHTSDSGLVMRRINVSGNIFEDVDQTHIFVRPNGACTIEEVVVSGNVATISMAQSDNKGLLGIGTNVAPGGGVVQNAVVSNNIGRGHIGYFIQVGGGVDVGTTYNIAVTGNSFDGRRLGQASPDSTSESSLVTVGEGVYGCTITGNTSQYTGRAGIRVSECQNVNITGNSVSYAVQNENITSPTPDSECSITVFDGCKNIVVSDNYIYNHANATVAASFNCRALGVSSSTATSGTENVTVSGNTVVEDRSGTEGTEYGISIGFSNGTAYPNNVNVIGNMVVGAKTRPYYSYGTGTHRVHGNSFGATDSGQDTVDCINGARWVKGQLTESITLSTSGLTTDSTANLLPANSIIEAVVARITTTITTTTNWALGDSAQAARFTTANATLTAGTTSVGLNHMNPTVATADLGPVQTSAAKLRITCTGSNPGAGAIRVTVFYRQFVAPTE